MLTLLINLDRSADRLVYMTNLLNSLKINFKRIPAVNGKELDPSIVQASTLTPGELGCFKSHIIAWEELLKTDHQYALILEDDVCLSKHTKSFLENTDILSLKFDIIKLETNFTEVFIQKSYKLKVEHLSLHRLLTIHYGTGGYIIHREYAQKILKQCSQPNIPVDVFLFCQESILNSTILQATPALVMQPIFLEGAPYFESMIRNERTVKRLENKETSRLKKIHRELVRPIKKIYSYLRLSLAHSREGKRQKIDFLE